MLRRAWAFFREEYAAWRLGRAYKEAYKNHEYVRRFPSPYGGTIDGPYDNEADLEPDDDYQT